MSKSSRLAFKGENPIEKKKKRKRKVEADGDDAATPPGREDASHSGPQEGWVFIDTLDDIRGPIMLLSTATEPPSVLVCSDNTSKVQFMPIPSDHTLVDFDPSAVTQVMVAKRLPDSTKVSFRAANDRYLGSDRIGVVGCEREAMGPAEEWELVVREDGVALQSAAFEKFLQCDEAGKARADSTVVGFRETFRVKCQAENKVRAKKKSKREGAVDAAALEIEQIKKFHSWGGGRLVLTQEDTAELRRANKEGTINETLLDRRAKLKSDKFCK
ncbi:FRG1-like family-domain-containing protein [Fimicolochytrium jonesii]|uniref:FRG1-like family-domain-containing protein n=1 Tax=Fimicolochytrium jonesii TaxID=1396493 RepID=UPI0022FE4689|nr:FRG1-like family-domain-containing protein [Fimicolochytrium jonesii]KAI8823737.1 FRG1-like family-domain-containing protein [Fimicolochytrium jonesii]